MGGVAKLRLVKVEAGDRSKTFDVFDPEVWERMVEAAAEAIAERTWGPAHWYRGAATSALCAALGLDKATVDQMMDAHKWNEDGS